MSTVEAPEKDLRPEIERIKERKDGLDVVHALRHAAANGGFSALAKDDLVLAKWWGVYPQRPEEDGYLMMRVRIPNGALTSEQLRLCGELANRYGRGLADITTRQCLQFHWLTVEDLPDIFDRLEACGMTAAQACGDVWRNVVGCPLSGVIADEHFDATPQVFDLTRHFLGNRRFSNLPRKFKVAVSSCRHHCAQHEINDLAFVAVEHPELGWGYDVWVGGGLGPSARMSRRIDVFVSAETITEVAEGVTALHRDHGNRLSGPGRIKFLVDEWGAWFRDAPRGVPRQGAPALRRAGGRATPMRDHVGVTPQAEAGRYALGGASKRGRTSGEALIGLADLAEARGYGRIRLTNRQNLILLDIAADELERDEGRHGPARVPGRAHQLPAPDDQLHRHRVLPARHLRDEGAWRARSSTTSRPASATSTRPSGSTSTAARTPAPSTRSPTSACRVPWPRRAPRRCSGSSSTSAAGWRRRPLRGPHRQADPGRRDALRARAAPHRLPRREGPDESFGLWVDRQPEGRLATIVGVPVIASRDPGDVILRLGELAGAGSSRRTGWPSGSATRRSP